MARKPARKTRETFGAIRKRDSGRYQASFVTPDGERRNAPQTFDTLGDARNWLARQQAALASGTWAADERARAEEESRAKALAVPLGEYAAEWINGRTSAHGEALRGRTVEEYRRLWRSPTALLPLADVPLGSLKTAQVRAWHRAILDAGTKTTAARAYGHLRSVYATAVAEGLLPANPVAVRGASSSSTGRKATLPTSDQVDDAIAALPPRYRVPVMIAAYLGLRSGELRELRRSDLAIVETPAGEVVRVSITRGVTKVAGAFVIGPPKSSKGARKVTLPPRFTDAVRSHLGEHVEPGPDALLLPATADPARTMNDSTLWKVWDRARQTAGAPTLRIHDLRHFGITRVALTGATQAQLMEWGGHSTAAVSARYQHAILDHDLELAALL